MHFYAFYFGISRLLCWGSAQFSEGFTPCNIYIWLFTHPWHYIWKIELYKTRDHLIIMKQANHLIGHIAGHDSTSHLLHGNSNPKIGCHYFWPGLIALPKNTLPIGWRIQSNHFVLLSLFEMIISCVHLQVQSPNSILHYLIHVLHLKYCVHRKLNCYWQRFCRN